MYDSKVPALWRKASWESSTLGFWFTELLERNEQFSRWIYEGRPHAFWMTGFFNPQGLLDSSRRSCTMYRVSVQSIVSKIINLVTVNFSRSYC